MKGPLARKKDLIVKKLDDELCVYDVERHRAHSLAPLMASLWHRCDGRTPPIELARALAVDVELVAVSIERLRDAHLIVDDGTPRRRGPSRRQWLKQATALGLAVASITVPTLAEAASTITTAECARRTPPNCGNTPCNTGDPTDVCRTVILGGRQVCRCG
jgi:hypothetical protein